MSAAPTPSPAATPPATASACPWPLPRRGDRVPDECADLRAAGGVARVRTLTGDEAWLVTSHALAQRVLADGRLSLSGTSQPDVPRQYALTIPPAVVNTMGNINSAGLHQEVLKALGPRSGEAHPDWLREQAHGLLDGIVAEGPPVDLRERFAAPYSAALLCQVLGLPFRDWRQLMSGLDLGFLTSPEAFEGCTANWDKDYAYVLRLVRAAPETQRGLVRTLCALRRDPERDGGELTDDMLAAVVTSLFGAGAMSTTAFLLHAVLDLVRHPETLRRLRDEPALMPRAVDELLRYNLSIGDGLPRVALADVPLGDVLVRSGELVLVCVEGANYDPEAFPDPERLDIDRSPNPHLSFGGGRHFCPASSLARTHTEVALEALLERLPDLRLAVPTEQLVWRTGFIKRLPERLPVLW